MERVFVYGTLKKGFCNHAVLGKSAVFIGDYITGKKYKMYDCGSYPALRLEGTTAIIGEVYDIIGLDRLDQLEGYPILYDRIQIETDYGMAWVYYMTQRSGQYPYNPNEPCVVIESGEWK